MRFWYTQTSDGKCHVHTDVPGLGPWEYSSEPEASRAVKALANCAWRSKGAQADIDAAMAKLLSAIDRKDEQTGGMEVVNLVGILLHDTRRIADALEKLSTPSIIPSSEPRAVMPWENIGS